MSKNNPIIFSVLFIFVSNMAFAQETDLKPQNIVPETVPNITSQAVTPQLVTEPNTTDPITDYGSDKLRIGGKSSVKEPAIELPNINGLPTEVKLPNKPLIATPTRNPTKEEIAHDIAPNFNINKDYNRLVTCYGTADYMSAFSRVRANRAGSPPQLKIMADQIAALKYQMQPMVLVASTLKTEARFRTDYDRVARGVQNRISAAANPDPIFQAQLKTLTACQADLKKWRGQ